MEPKSDLSRHLVDGTGAPLSNEIVTIDNRSSDFNNHVLPLRKELSALGYDQRHDFIRFSPFDIVSQHFLRLDRAGRSVGVISAVDVASARDDISEYFQLPFNPGKAAMLARFAVEQNIGGGLSGLGPKMLTHLISKFKADGYDYLFGEMSPPYLSPDDVKSQGEVVRYYLKFRQGRIISAFALDEIVPTIVVGIALTDEGRRREELWRAGNPAQSARLEELERLMIEHSPTIRSRAWLSLRS